MPGLSKRHCCSILAAALGIASGSAEAQATRAGRAARVDTLLSEVRGIPNAAEQVFRSSIVRRLEPGVGAEGGMIVHSSEVRQEGSPSGGLRSRQRIVVDAVTRAFRSGLSRTEQPSGDLIVETRVSVVGGRLLAITRRGTAPKEPDTTWLALPVGGAVLYGDVGDVLARIATESGPTGAGAAGSAYDVAVASPPFLQRLVLDSIGPRAPSGVVRITAHIDSAGQRFSSMVASVDAVSGDVAQAEWRARNGVISTLTNLSLRRRVADASSLRTPGGDAAARGPLVGRYRLEGEREMASEIVLRRDGRFEYALAYGALDESGEGRWRVSDGQVVLQSDGAAHEPSVRLTAATGITTDSVVVLVTDTAGAPVHGIEVDVVQPRTGTSFAHARQGRHVVHFTKGDAPTELSVGYDVLDFMVHFPIAGKPKAVYRFVFDRGDLGRYRFEGARLDVEGTTLVLVRNGHRMQYVRQ